MNNNAEAAERAAPFDAPDKVVGKLHSDLNNLTTPIPGAAGKDFGSVLKFYHELATAYANKTVSYDNFKTEFTKAGMTQFGSGWAWLSLDGRQLVIEQTPNQNTPLSQGRAPLLTMDVWEHAYYLKYQNRRADYVAAFYNVINWDFVSERYAKLAS